MPHYSHQIGAAAAINFFSTNKNKKKKKKRRKKEKKEEKKLVPHYSYQIGAAAAIHLWEGAKTVHVAIAAARALLFFNSLFSFFFAENMQNLASVNRGIFAESNLV